MSRSMALSVTMILRAQAAMTSSLGLPWLRSRAAKAEMVGLLRIADMTTM